MSELPWLISQTYRRAVDRHASLFAAGVAFYVFLSLFPALIAAVFSYGLVADAETVARHGERLAQLLPDEAASIVTGQLDALADNPPSTLGWGVSTALAFAFWSASRGAFNFLKAIQWIFGLEDVRSAFRQRLLALTMMAGAIVFVMISIGLIAALPPVLSFLQLEGLLRLLRYSRWLVLAAAVVGAIGVLFRLAARERVRRPRQLATPGVLVASSLWLVVSLGFSVYVDELSNYGQTYGALTGVVVLMIWIWLSTLSVLVGAAFEVTYEERFER